MFGQQKLPVKVLGTSSPRRQQNYYEPGNEMKWDEMS